jgi:hypothetical protein
MCLGVSSSFLERLHYVNLPFSPHRRRRDSQVHVVSHREVFGWVLGVLADRGLVKGKRIAIDATTLEANAAMRSIVRRDTGESYEEFLRGLAKASGIETPSREDLARLDRKRKKRMPNKDWESAADGDARITKMKDGRTHLAHKAEHAVDLDTVRLADAVSFCRSRRAPAADSGTPPVAPRFCPSSRAAPLVSFPECKYALRNSSPAPRPRRCGQTGCLNLIGR